MVWAINNVNHRRGCYIRIVNILSTTCLRYKFNVNNTSASVSRGNGFGASVQDTGTVKTLTTYFRIAMVS
jgi:hypothetical protein